MAAYALGLGYQLPKLTNNQELDTVETVNSQMLISLCLTIMPLSIRKNIELFKPLNDERHVIVIQFIVQVLIQGPDFDLFEVFRRSRTGF